VVHSRRELFEAAARTVDGIELEWLLYGDESVVREKVAPFLARTRLDGLVAGLVPFGSCRDLFSPSLPVGVIRPSALDLSLALYRAQERGWRPTPVSLDTFAADAVESVVDALELDPAEVANLPYSPDQTVDDIAGFHRAIHERTGGRSYVVSNRAAVIARLRGAIPILSGMPEPTTIRSTLHELVLRIESQRANAQRFAAGIFVVPRSPDQDRARIGLMNLLLNTPEFADALIEDRGRRGVVVFAHKALFERITENWVAVPALDEAARALGVRVSAGFGVGTSARNCVRLAEQAATRAEAADDPCGYLIEDSGVIIGPMGAAKSSLTYSYRAHGRDLERVARAVGLSATTVSRLAALDASLNGRTVSPSELAESLGITDPSGRRLIRKLAAAELVTSEGTAQTHPRGRPTRLYRLRVAEVVDLAGRTREETLDEPALHG
jgi:hypothetical protein